MQGTGKFGRLDAEGAAFAATVVVFLVLLLVAILFFGTVFVAPLG
jgi:hypothetical protein